MSFLNRFRRQKEDEAARFARLLRTGRITDGSVLDLVSDDSDSGLRISYSYEVASVEYESSQTLNEDQKSRSGSYAPGSTITVRYDHRQPGNSIVV